MPGNTGDRTGRAGIGAAKVRSEDARLITGQGAYTSDVTPANVAYAVIVRSSYAHAAIQSIDISKAVAKQGVLAVLTGTDAALDGLTAMPHNVSWRGPPDALLRAPPGYEPYTTEHLPLPQSRVRYVGEPVAVVVAETPDIAADAAELVDVDYRELPAVTDARDAMLPDAPRIWADCERNIALTCEVGDQAATDIAFASAAHVVKFEGVVNRVTGSPMEPRAVIGEFTDGRYILHTASGSGAVRTRDRLAEILGVDASLCRVIMGDMGGNFGTRNAFFPEAALIPWAAKRVGRAVKWVATRVECFVSDYQARDFVSAAELALDQDGNFLALRGVNIVNLGAHTVYFWPLRKGLSMMQGVYRIPQVFFEGHAVLTNTMPTAVYRSAGRPEAIYVIERLVDLAAQTCGFERVELRRRNLIPEKAMPFTTAVGVTYDSGDYAAAMDRVLAESKWEDFPARRAEAAARARYRGIGIANYIEVTSGFPNERAELTVLDDGSIELAVGTMSSGQGHETTFPQLVSEWLDIPFGQVSFVANDTDRITVGGGSHSGRSMRLVSIVVATAVEALLAKAKTIATHLLQTTQSDISYSNGEFTAADHGSVGFAELARAAQELQSLPVQLRGKLTASGDISDHTGGYPYGAHVCEVEVDPETGQVEIVAWTAVDDVGLAVNPLVLHGQAHGAVTQGIGQALCEEIRYDPTGQILTGSFMDYAMPRADTVPPIDSIITEYPASSHPFGIRPGGEGGTTPALALVINAVVDALSSLDITHIDLPATPQRVWQAIKASSHVSGL
jgi:carbon-monoxide dehydrogenase large subunit